MSGSSTIENVICKITPLLGLTEANPLFLYDEGTKLYKAMTLTTIYSVSKHPDDAFLYLDYSDLPCSPKKMASPVANPITSAAGTEGADAFREKCFRSLQVLENARARFQTISSGDHPEEILALALSTLGVAKQAMNDIHQMPSQNEPEHYRRRMKRMTEIVRPKSETGFVGLANQGATCYVNSLLQTLFMTVEFRRELLSWLIPSEQQTVTNIPFQLQKLFAYLQHGASGVQNTSDLTRSFGWGFSDSLMEHDVQEFNRVLFDALQKYVDKLQSTPNASRGFLTELYEGILTDFIQCLHCKGGRRRVDAYQDVSLVVRGMHTLEDCIDQFVQPELLDGSNQYQCETCQAKRDANKGLSFQTFPRILTLQLCRFGYEALGRVKLNDEICVPLVLDVSRWLPKSTSAADNDDTQNTTETRSTVYDLFSVLVHRGTAAGGHYFAYIRTLHDDAWYRFSDEQVDRVTHEEVRRILHLEETQPSVEKVIESSEKPPVSVANPYMLVYRSRALPVPDYTTCTIPTALREKIDAENQEIEKDLAEYHRLKDLIEVKIYEPGLESFKWVVMQKQDTLAVATEKAYHEILSPAQRAETPLNCVRLRRYNSKQNVRGPSFSVEDENKPLGELGVEALSALALETKLPDVEWSSVLTDDLGLNVHLWDPDQQKFVQKGKSVVKGDATFDEFLIHAAALSGWPKDKLVVTHLGRNPRPIVIDPEAAKLKGLTQDLNMYPNQPIYVELAEHHLTTENVNIQSPLFVSTAPPSIDVYFNLPDESEPSQTFKIGSFLPLCDFKSTFAQKLGLDVKDFFVKLSKTSKSEIGDSPKSRIRSLLSPKEWAARSLTVFIELQPRPDALTICLHRYTGPSGDFKFLYKCTHPRDITVTELKQSVSERLQVPATHLRLREIFEFSELQVTIKICRKPLLNGRVAEYFSSPEGVPVLIAVQELPEPDRITNMDLILRVVDIPKDLSFFSFADG